MKGQTFNGLVGVRAVLVHVDGCTEEEPTTHDTDETSHVESVLHADKLDGDVRATPRYLVRYLLKNSSNNYKKRNNNKNNVTINHTTTKTTYRQPLQQLKFKQLELLPSIAVTVHHSLSCLTQPTYHLPMNAWASENYSI